MGLTYREVINQLKETYETVAREFSQTRSKPWEEMEKLGKGVLEGARVLDIGCGNGRLLSVLPKNIQYLGVDICKGLVEEARRIYPERRFIVGDFLALPYKRIGKDYDFIFAIAVLHHLPTMRTRLNFLKKAKKLLNNRGKLMLTVWNLWKEEKYREKINEKGDIIIPFGKDKAPRYYHAFKKEEIEELAKKAGFVIEKIEENRNLIAVLKCYD
jgi:tRNA (uracil-5-)-methyltransferase TRM9